MCTRTPFISTHFCLLFLVLLVPSGRRFYFVGSSAVQSDEATQGTANELYLKARMYEDQKQLLHALRTLKTGHRLVPLDSRFTKKLKQFTGILKGHVEVEGCPTRLPVLVPRDAHKLAPGSPGSADDLVATFFKWQRIPIFRNDSEQCAIHSAGHDTIFTVMGHTCLSSVYVASHNRVQGLFAGEFEGSWLTAIPNASSVGCGERCGVDVPPVPSSLITPSKSRYCDPIWEGTVEGHRVEICRGEKRSEALARLVATGRIPQRAVRGASEAIARGVVEALLPERAQLLAAAGPYVHRSQIVGSPWEACVRDGGCGREAGETCSGEDTTQRMPVRTVHSTARTHQEEEEDPVEWDVGSNRVFPREVDADAEAAQRFLWHHQHPADCSARPALVFHHDRAYWGFAANVHFMTVAFNHAVAFNRTFLTKNPDHWNYGGNDCSAGWECYFEPVSSCSEYDVWEPYSVPVRGDFRWDHRGYLYRVDTREQRVLSYANVDGPWQEAIGNSRHVSGVSVRKWIPEQFRHRGLLWWRAQVTRYLFRPKRFVLGFISERMAAAGLEGAGAVVGLHVRHGDKAYDMYQGSYFGGIDSYALKAKALLPHPAALYVSTDDPDVIHSLPQTEQAHSVRCLHDPLERRYNGSHIYAPPGISLARWPAFPGNDPMVNTTMYALETIKSIWILSLGVPGFVGTVTSSMSRLIYQLRVAFGQEELQDEWTVDKDLRHDKGWFADP